MKTNSNSNDFGRNCKTLLLIFIFSVCLFATVTNAQQTYGTIDFQQASNENHPTDAIIWINGILNPNNSDYTEGVGIPQRIIFTGIVPTTGNTHVLTFGHQAVKGGVRAYDFLISWSQAVQTAADLLNNPVNELQDLFAQECDQTLSAAGIPPCLNNTNHFAAIVDDVMLPEPPTVSCGLPPQVDVGGVLAGWELEYGQRVVDLYGDAPITAATVTFINYTSSGSDSYANYELHWTSASSTMVILMAGRSAQSCNSGSHCHGYGAGCGAGSINGPVHFKLFDLDGHTTGNQDNPVQISALVPAPICADLTISSTSPGCPNTTQTHTASIGSSCTNAVYSWSITSSTNSSLATPTSGTGASATINSGTTCGSYEICFTVVCDEGQIVCCTTVVVQDITPPVFTNCTPGSDLGTNPIIPTCVNQTVPTVTDNCGVPTVTCVEGNIINTSLTGRSRTITWTATDACGNTAICVTTLTWTEDSSPQCLNISGNNPVGTNSVGNVYTINYSGTCTNVTHHWIISGNGNIIGSASGPSVSVNTGIFGPFTLLDTITCDEGQTICSRTIDVYDSSTEWIPLATNVTENLSKIQFTTNTTGFAVGYNSFCCPLIYTSSAIVKTINEGNSWNTVYSSFTDFVIDLDFPTPTKGYAVTGPITQGSGIKKQNFSANTWTDIGTIPSGNVTAFCFVSNSHGFAGDASGNVFQTTDGGVTWSSGTFIGVVSVLESFAFFNNNTGIAVGHDNGVIAKTIDGGNTWNIITQSYNLNSVYTRAGGTAFAVGPNSTIVKSTDHGNTWDTLTAPIAGLNLNSVYCASNSISYAVGDYGAIIKTIDGGLTWQLQNSGTPFDLNSINCTSANTCYAAGDKGLALKTIVGGNRMANPESNSESADGFVFYPNPAYDVLNFIFEENINHNIKISNTLGQLILETETEQQQFSLNVKQLPNGIYFISIMGRGEAVVMKKFIKM